MKYPKRSQYKYAKQKKYRRRNWGAYNDALRRRGDLTIWFCEDAIGNWENDLMYMYSSRSGGVHQLGFVARQIHVEMRASAIRDGIHQQIVRLIVRRAV